MKVYLLSLTVLLLLAFSIHAYGLGNGLEGPHAGLDLTGRWCYGDSTDLFNAHKKEVAFVQ